MDRRAEGFLEPFKSVGITPPRGRQGHSVPTPRPLQGSKLVHVAGRIEDKGKVLPQPPSLDPPDIPIFPPKACPTQFSMRRDHSLGGSVSRLDRIRVHNQDILYQMESFAEHEEEGGGEGEDYRDDSELWADPSYYGTSRKTNDTLDKFTGDSLLHFSFNPGGNLMSTNEPQLGGSFVQAFSNQGLHTSLNVPSVHHMQSSGGESLTLFPSAARNPNKAIVTIDAQSSLILMTNEITCELFGYQCGDLVGMKVQNLFTEPYRAKQHALVEQNIDASGKEVLVSGKVLDAVTAYGVEFPVSVWMKKISVSSGLLRVIVVMEPVERTSACFSIDHQGCIVSCDPWFASLFGYPNTPAVMGQSVFSLMPSISLPHSLQEITKLPDKQAVTGRTKDNTAFPLTVQFTNLSHNLSIGDLYSPSHTLPPGTPPHIPTSTLPPGTPPNIPTSTLPPGTPPNIPTSTPPPGTPPNIPNNTLPPGTPPHILTSKLPPGTPPHIPTSTPPPGTPPHIPNSTVTPPTCLPAPTNEQVVSNPSMHPLAMGEVPIDLIATLSPTKKCGDSAGVGVGKTPQNNNNDVITGEEGEVPPSLPPEYINAKVIVYATLSGMVSFLPDGMVHGCNHHFSLMLFGYSQEELLKKDITFLIPDFYNHIGYVDDRGMPLPPLDEESDEISFQSVPERSLSPDAAFDYIKSRGACGHVPPSPVRRKNHHEVQRSPGRKSNVHYSPSHHYRPLNPANQLAVNSEGSPQHQIRNREVASLDKIPPGGTSGPQTMPTLIEERESCGSSRSTSTYDACTSVTTSGTADKSHIMTGTKNDASGTRTIGTGMEILERDGAEVGQGEVGNQSLGLVVSSTPTSKASDSTLASLKKSNSFQEYLGAAGGGDCDRCSITSIASLPEGLFEGFIRHKDGSSIAVIFQLKCIPLAGDQSVFCMWVCRDLDRGRARNSDLRPDPYWADQVVSPEVTEDVDGNRDPHYLQPNMGYEESLAMDGVYKSSYDTLQSLGKGAFGFVRLAQRKSDQLMVVVKFLRKSGVLKDCWVDDEDMGRVALEISLLARLNHPNIVMLLEAYENEHYFQLVMEKHGDGLDLFEFIERCPKVTEPLVSYMFRQVVAGLSYLHSENILHRDVKDENIIMDRQFHIKLIDFGSAAYMLPGKLFHTFCGTLEYCAPEVLLGNSYPGPELEMWALGVTLYTLMFGENPFFDVEETISGHLQPPYLTSPGLMKVLFWLLHPHPKSRATLKDLEKDKWTNQEVDITKFDFETVLGYSCSKQMEGVPCDLQQKSHSNANPRTIEELLESQLSIRDSHGNGYHSDQGD